jgi:tRNA pseudouridine32 synthase / 23S rRNA pseudouridine746 synthase
MSEVIRPVKIILDMRANDTRLWQAPRGHGAIGYLAVLRRPPRRICDKRREHVNPALPPILHLDERIIVLDKPAGLLSVPGIGEEKRDCLAVRVAREYSGARIVHRLDRDTSGVIIMARDAEAHRELSRQFHDREVSKTYIAVVAGVIEDDSGVIDLPMCKDMDPANAPRQVIDHAEGRTAVTHWWVQQRMADRTRVLLKPITGRSHQLRLHLKSVGHPILGDDLYAPANVLAMADRLMLHAQSLTVVHPETARLMTFEAGCPF